MTIRQNIFRHIFEQSVSVIISPNQHFCAIGHIAIYVDDVSVDKQLAYKIYIYIATVGVKKSLLTVVVVRL